MVLSGLNPHVSEAAIGDAQSLYPGKKGARAGDVLVTIKRTFS